MKQRHSSRSFPLFLLSAALCVLCGEHSFAEAPAASYLFPAGGRRGTTVAVRVGGLCLHDRCAWELLGPGVTAGTHLTRTKTRWFEGPMLPLPASQQQEDYPQDMAGEVAVAADAALGVRRGRLWTSEGAHGGLAFQVGDLPEVVEQEADGDPLPVEVRLPVTVNGRVFPREDIDAWSFTLRKGQAIGCEVHAARLGSPLDARLELRGPDGDLIAENDDARGADPLVHFVAPKEGKYVLRIDDSQRGGGQRHVYRLTVRDGPFVAHAYPLGGRKGTTARFTLGGAGVPNDGVALNLGDAAGVAMRSFSVGSATTNAVPLDVDDLLEALEAEPNDGPATAAKVVLPCVLNGRIDRPGDADCWRFEAKKGQSLQLEMRGGLLGSPLAGVVEVLDDTGKALTKGAPRAAELLFTAPRDGGFVVRLRDQFRTRGGPAFAYRLRLTEARPDFRLELPSVAHSVVRGEKAILRLKVVRSGGFAGPVALSVTGLPAGVKVTPVTVNAGQPQVDLAFTADKDAAVNVGRVRIVGSMKVGDRTVDRVAAPEMEPGELPVDDALVAVGLKAPFKVVGAYDLRLAARGTVFRKKFRVERNGYAGPLEVRLADRQARHLQGVTGPTLTIAPDVSEFEYPVTLPPWMETGRTSRACVMATGKVTIDGVEHAVSFTSQQQNEQLIAVVETGQLSLEPGRASLAVKPGGSAELPFGVRRGKGLTGPVTVELIVPDHAAGLSADAVTVAADASAGALTVRSGRRPGPLTTAALLRATIRSADGPVTAEAKVELTEE